MSAPETDPVQQAVAGRLAKLRALPVDTSRLDRAMRAQISPVPAGRRRWWAPLAAVAASLLILASVLFIILAPGTVQASPNDMVQMHNDIVSGKTPTMKVDSIEAANKAIAAMAQGAPQLPNAPAEHTMACCIRNVGNKKVSCVLLKNDGVPVTISVARAADVTPPQNTTTVVRDGVSYHVQNIDKLHMVMLTHDGNWICLISEAPAETLITLAARLQH